MHPVAVQHAAEQAASGGGGAPQGAEREGAVGAGVGVVGAGDVDAHVGERRGGGLAPEGQSPIVAEEEVAAALEADGAFAPGQQQGGVHALGVPQADEIRQRVAPVDPDAVDIGDEDGIVAEQGTGLLQAAAGLQQFGALVGDDDGGTGAGGQMAFQPVGEPVDIDHGLLNTGLGQPVEDVVDQGASADLHQGLGPVVGQGAHPRAEPGGEDHGGLGGGGGGGHRRTSSGTWRSIQAATGSRPGAFRLAFRWAHMRGMKAAYLGLASRAIRRAKMPRIRASFSAARPL
ncbi:hypothetical protein D3C72_1247120 [compost metagenome]